MNNIITTLEQLVEYIPTIIKLWKKDPKLFEEGYTEENIVQELTNDLCCGNLFFGNLREGIVEYFISTRVENILDNKILFVTLVYVNPKAKIDTILLLKNIISFVHSVGFKDLRFCTHRFGKAYDKFMEKLGGNLFSCTYQIKIED